MPAPQSQWSIDVIVEFIRFAINVMEAARFILVVFAAPAAILSDRAAVAQVAVVSKIDLMEQANFLKLHNQERREVGVPPLEWSPKLAAFAQAWADELARTGNFEHRPVDGEWKQRYGENLAIGYGDKFGPNSAVRMWTAEKEQYEPGTPIPDDFATFKAGHYTQIVWRGTSRVGAGKAMVQTGERAGWTIIVANYDPPGNRYGEKPY